MKKWKRLSRLWITFAALTAWHLGAGIAAAQHPIDNGHHQIPPILGPHIRNGSHDNVVEYFRHQEIITDGKGIAYCLLRNRSTNNRGQE